MDVFLIALGVGVVILVKVINKATDNANPGGIVGISAGLATFGLLALAAFFFMHGFGVIR